MFLTDLINLIVAPNATSWAALFFDFFNFMIMPVFGGVLMTSVNYNYERDPQTFVNAEITKTQMYGSQMKLLKTGLYNAIGKPNFFEDEAKYIPPLVADWNADN